MKWLFFLLVFASAVFACDPVIDGMLVTESMTLCSETYDLPSGIRIAGSNIVFDCGTAVLRGILGQSEIGVRVDNATNITIRKCNVVTFNQGLYLKNVTSSLVEDNAFLKNRIGIRMLDSFENVIRDNGDKSYQFAVSAINSKYNVVMLDNKNVERAFCEENACNKFREMNVCEAGDFYCSPKCSPVTDADCGLKTTDYQLQTTNYSPPADALKTTDYKLPTDNGQSPVGAVVQESAVGQDILEVEQRKLSWPAKLLVYVLLYLVTLAVLRVVK
ncbi:right-handed parallel beta-helix repeat-containing protein [Candidatus Woesearchaeota archaeon]|nr:right-handed parallel beta-helix repeat-containing protein [Candidatus Woesearchaeota archaeon]